MPILTKGVLNIEYIDEGDGPTVVLLHSSASNNRQWQPLLSGLKRRRRVIAPNLFGYGATSPWHGPSPQSISAQAELVCAVLANVEGPVDFVGHSFGALIALEAAVALGKRAGKLVLFEPNPFAILNRPGHLDLYAETSQLHRHVKEHGLRGEWLVVAERFADYFSGDGSWAALPVERRSALAAALAPNLHEWDAVMDCELSPSRFNGVKRALLVWAKDTRASLRAIVEILREQHMDWNCCEIERGGHMTPLTRPRSFNVHVEGFISDP